MAAASNADVTLIERNAIMVPPFRLDVAPLNPWIATADMMTRFSEAGSLGYREHEGYGAAASLVWTT